MATEQHFTDEQIEEFRKGIESPTTFSIQDNAHAESCAECRNRIRHAFSNGKLDLSSWFEVEETVDECIEEDLKFRYVDNEVNDIEREIVEGHISYCYLCKLDIEDLNKLEAPLAVQTHTRSGFFPFNKFSAVPLLMKAANKTDANLLVRSQALQSLTKADSPEANPEDIFVHMETVRQAEIVDLEPEQRLEARIAAGKKGLTAVEVRLA